MKTGYLKAVVTTGGGSLPVQATVNVLSDGEILDTLQTDENGITETMALEAPPHDSLIPYSVCDVKAEALGYRAVHIYGIHIFESETSILPINMVPATESDGVIEHHIPPHQLVEPVECHPAIHECQHELLQELSIPEYITVYIEKPNDSAQNLQVPFVSYIKNAASHAIYPNWPNAAIEANIYCIISLALSRVYQQPYKSKGHDFDIANNIDQVFVDGSHILGSIDYMVDYVFNRFIKQSSQNEPFPALYSDGKYITCPGLWQWGTVQLADRGYDALEILRHYYPPDIEIVESKKIDGIIEQFPDYALNEGMSGHYVEVLQSMLNKFSMYYPGIPAISQEDAIFGSETAAAVRAFQSVFELASAPSGIVDWRTWHRVSQVLSAINRHESASTTPASPSRSSDKTPSNGLLTMLMLSQLIKQTSGLNRI